MHARLDIDMKSLPAGYEKLERQYDVCDLHGISGEGEDDQEIVAGKVSSVVRYTLIISTAFGILH